MCVNGFYVSNCIVVYVYLNVNYAVGMFTFCDLLKIFICLHFRYLVVLKFVFSPHHNKICMKMLRC